MIRVAIESTVQEFRIADNCLKQFFRITGVGQITSAFSCNIDLFAQFFIFFKQMNFAPCVLPAFSAANSLPPLRLSLLFSFSFIIPFLTGFFSFFSSEIKSPVFRVCDLGSGNSTGSDISAHDTEE